MMSGALPQRSPALAWIVTVPGFSVVKIAPPVVLSVSIATMLGSEALHSTAAPLTPLTMAGT
jgi:hypothetical protein